MIEKSVLDGIFFAIANCYASCIGSCVTKQNIRLQHQQVSIIRTHISLEMSHKILETIKNYDIVIANLCA